jgi:hypothetical protein
MPCLLLLTLLILLMVVVSIHPCPDPLCNSDLADAQPAHSARRGCRRINQGLSIIPKHSRSASCLYFQLICLSRLRRRPWVLQYHPSYTLSPLQYLTSPLGIAVNLPRVIVDCPPHARHLSPPSGSRRAKPCPSIHLSIVSALSCRVIYPWFLQRASPSHLSIPGTETEMHSPPAKPASKRSAAPGPASHLLSNTRPKLITVPRRNADLHVMTMMERLRALSSAMSLSCRVVGFSHVSDGDAYPGKPHLRPAG